MNESMVHSKGSYCGDEQHTRDSDLQINTRAATQPSKHSGSGFEMIPISSDFTSSPRQARLPCFLMEPHNEWAYSRRSHFDAVFWVAADEASKLGTAFCQIALELGLEDSLHTQNQIVSRELVKGWLADPKKSLDMGEDGVIVDQEDARWLLIFDNAENIDALDDYWPVRGNGSLLITSRDPLAKTTHSMGASHIDLEPFSTAEGAKFLRQLTLISDEDAESEQVVERLGGLPLAITQMAGIIRTQGLSFSDLMERYEDDQEFPELHSLSIEGTDQRYNRTIASVWDFDKLSLAAQSILKVTAFLDPDCIPEKIYLEGAAGVDLREYPRKQTSMASAKAELVQASLIKRNPVNKEIWVHRLVQDSLRAKMSAEETESIISAAIHLVSTLWPHGDITNRHSTKFWKQCEELYPYIIAIAKLYGQLFEKHAVKSHAAFATLLNAAGWWQHERGNSHEVRYVLELALSICARIDGGGSVALVGDLHHTLGAIANETNDPVGCLEHSEKLFKIRQDVAAQTGVKDFRYAVGCAQYATALVMNNDLDTAIDMYESAVAAIQRLPDFTKPMLCVTVADLGFALWLRGDLDEASRRLEESIKDREEILGPNDTESYRLGFLLHALGNVRWSQNRLDQSFELHNRALLSYQATIGTNHHRTADVCHRVAKHYIRLGLYEPAMTMIDQALKTWLVDHRSYKQEIARTSFLKSKVYELQNNEAGAAQAHKTALDLVMEVTGMSLGRARELREADFDEMVTFWSR